MKIIKYKKIKDNRYEIIFDNDDKIIFYDDIIIKFNLLSYQEIDNNLLTKIKKANEKKDAYYVAIKYISKKLRSKKEIVDYLKKFNYNISIIDQTVKELINEGYLNEDIYIDSYINDAVYLSKKGPLKIKKELLNLNLKEEKINEKLSKIDDKIWLERIEKIISKKISSNNNNGPRIIREKTFNHLITLGYPKELIQIKIDDFNYEDENVLKKEYEKLKLKLSKKYCDKELKFHIKNKLYIKGFTTDAINKMFEDY